MKKIILIIGISLVAIALMVVITISSKSTPESQSADSIGKMVALKDTKSKYDYASRISNNVVVNFKARANQKPSYQMVYSGGKAGITFTLDSIAKSTNDGENFVEYNVNVEEVPMLMRLTTTQGIVKEDFVINQKPQNLNTLGDDLEIIQGAEVDGLELQSSTQNGAIVFKSKIDSQTYTFPQPTVIDADGKQVKVQGAFSQNLKSYTVSIPIKLLSSFSYPITIDPTVITSNPVTDAASVMRQEIAEKYPQAEEVLAKRNESSKTFLLDSASQTYSWKGSIGEVHYKENPQDSLEQWKEIDTQVEPANASTTGYAFQNTTNNFKSFFKKNSTDTDTVKYEDGGSFVTFTNMDNELGTLKSVVGEARDNQFVYPNAYDKVDIRYSIGSRVLLEEYVLNEPREVSKISQKVHIENATYQQQADGSINFYSTKTHELVWSFPIPKMYEVNLRPDKKGVPSRFENFGLHYVITQEGNEYIVTKVIDEEGKSWLSSPEREYPLVIDTTLNLQVGAAGDDGEEYDAGGGSDGYFSSLFRPGFLTGVVEHGYARFTNVTIANAATIDSAVLTGRATSGGGGTNTHLKIHTNDVNSAVAPTDLASFQGLVLTTGTVWDAAAVETAGNNYSSADISPEVQTVVNRAGWASGNALAIIMKDNSSSFGYGIRWGVYEDSAATAIKLDINYTVVAPTNTPTPTPTGAPTPTPPAHPININRGVNIGPGVTIRKN